MVYGIVGVLTALLVIGLGLWLRARRQQQTAQDLADLAELQADVAKIRANRASQPPPSNPTEAAPEEPGNRDLHRRWNDRSRKK